jgi:GGDEF domain-containing protein
MVNIEGIHSLQVLRGSKAADELVRSAATVVGRRLNPLDAVAVMRDRCFAVLVEMPLARMTMQDFAELIQHDVIGIVREQNPTLDAAVTIGIAKLGRSYSVAQDVIRDAGIALRHARDAQPGSIMAYNRSMELVAAIAT